MTISNTIRTAGPFIGNGVTTAFPFTFKVFKKEEVLAVQTDVATGVATPLVLNSGYSVVLNADQNANPGGTATTASPLAVGQTLVLTSDLAYLQPLDITNGGGFYPAVLNAALDRLTIFCQQLFSLARRSIKFPLSDAGMNTELPSAVARANKLLGFDSSGNLLVSAPVSGSAADLAITFASNAGASFIGWILNAIGAAPRTVQDKLRESVSITDFYANGVSGAKVDPSGVLDSTLGIQAALNLRGNIYIPPGTYNVSSALTMYGNTTLSGAGMGVSILSWSGPTTGHILQDSSVVTPTNVNLNITLRDFEIAGNSYSDNPLYGIRMYRVGKAKYENLYVHDTGGALLMWGVSQADTVDIEISGCIFERSFNGDACQGIGKRVTVKDCYAFSSGDTCYAILFDTQTATNPSGLYASGVVFDNCKAVGEYNSSGVFTGAGRAAQLGFSFGPFGVNVNINAEIKNCTCEGLYQNVWMTVFRKLKIIGNTFKQHANKFTGGVRLDGVRNAVIEGNSFECVGSGSNVYYGALLLNAQRNVYGASIFDASNKYTVIEGNIFENNTSPGIVLAVDPTYSVDITDLVLSNNVFAGVSLPIRFSPLVSSGSGVFKSISIAGNTVDSSASSLIDCAGLPAQYDSVSLSNNVIGSVAPCTGSTDTILITGSNNITTAGVLTATATTVFTIPSFGYNSLQVQSWVQTGTGAFTAVAEIVMNRGTPRIAWKSDGANVAITLAGNAVQVTQAGVGTQTVYSTVKYIS